MRIDIDEDDWEELFDLINYKDCSEDIMKKMKVFIPFEIEEDNEFVPRQYTLNIPQAPSVENDDNGSDTSENETIIGDMKIERAIPSNGYINELIGKGLSDIEFQYANDENVKGNKMLLSLACKKFEEIFQNINDDNGVVILPNMVSRIGLTQIISYLGYGKVQITSANVIDILLSSSYFELKDLLIHCTNYINTHFNMRMMKRLLIAASDYWKYPEEIKPVLDDYIKYNGYRLLKTSIHIFIYFTFSFLSIESTEFSIESFRYLLNTEMIVKSENEILKYTLEFYDDYQGNHLDEGII